MHIAKFMKMFPSEASCLDYVFAVKYGYLKTCPSCGCPTSFKRVRTQRAYQCTECYHRIFPCVNTVFEKSTTPLTYWFFTIYLLANSRVGINANHLRRHLDDITYKTAAKILLKIFGMLVFPLKNGKLKGRVETDEVYISGKRKYQRGRSNEKVVALSMVERNGQAVAVHIPDTTQQTIVPLIQKYVDTSAILYTDEYNVYDGLSQLGYTHYRIKHKDKVYKIEDRSTNVVESFFSRCKAIFRTYKKMSKTNAQLYLNLATFQHNHRFYKDMFTPMLNAMII